MLNSYPVGSQSNQNPIKGFYSFGSGIGRSVALLVLSLGLVSGFASAQTFRGAVVGTIRDPKGVVVPGATVTAKGLDTGLERVTTSDSDGNYSVQELPIGRYSVTVQ